MVEGTIYLNNSSTSYGGGYLMGKIEWSSKEDIASNTSSVTADLYVAKENSTEETEGDWSYTLSIGSTTVSGYAHHTVLSAFVKVATQIVTVAHAADGSGSVTLSGSVTGPSGTSYAGLTTSRSETVALDTIPRASTASFGDFTMGRESTIAIQSADASFLHDVVLTWDGAYTYLALKTSGIVTWTPPLTLANSIPYATTGTGTITIHTYNAAGTLIGSNTYDATIYVPDSVVPTISNFSVALVNPNSVAAGWGVAIKGMTKLSWSSTVSGSYGSTIVEQCLVQGYNEWTGASGTTSILNASGTIQPYQYVKDSRGRIARYIPNDTITVYDYAAPTITASSAVRCAEDGTLSDTGTYVKLTLSASCASVGGRNSVSLRYRYKTVSGTFTGWSSLTSGSIVSGFDATASYFVELSAVDSLGGEKSVSVTIQTANVAFNLKDGGLGAAFGKYAEDDNLLESVWPLKIQGSTMSDFIVESGNNAYWTWRKWASGTAECWRLRQCGNVSCTVAWGAFFESTDSYGPDAYPFSFTLTPAQFMFANVATGGTVFVEPSGNSAVDSGSWWLYRPVSTSGITAYVSIYAIGKWK